MSRTNRYMALLVVGGLAAIVPSSFAAGIDLFQATDDGTSFVLEEGIIETSLMSRVNTTQPDVYRDFHLEVSVGTEETGVIGTEVFFTDDSSPDMWVEEEGVLILEGVLRDPGVVNGFLEALPQSSDNGWMRVVGEIEVTAVDPAAYPAVSVGDTLEYIWDFYPFDEPVYMGLFDDDWSSHSDVVISWVPEPAGLTLLGCGGLVLAVRRGRR